MAGWLVTRTGIPLTLTVLGGLTIAATTVAMRAWPAEDPEAIEHDHLDHEHLTAIPIDGRLRRTHPYRIGDLHTRWLAA